MMSVFLSLYDLTIKWSGHRNAIYYLSAVSFAESSFFPIPPDVMLISMGLAKPEKAWKYALITTFFSVLGGILGYCIGHFAIDLIYSYLIHTHYANTYHQVVDWFKIYGVWVVFLAGFSPIPYKFFTVAAGALSMPFYPFLLASIIGRGLRFFLVTSIIFFYGHHLHQGIRQYIDRIGWSLVFIFVIVFMYLAYH